MGWRSLPGLLLLAALTNCPGKAPRGLRFDSGSDLQRLRPKDGPPAESDSATAVDLSKPSDGSVPRVDQRVPTDAKPPDAGQPPKLDGASPSADSTVVDSAAKLDSTPIDSAPPVDSSVDSAAGSNPCRPTTATLVSQPLADLAFCRKLIGAVNQCGAATLCNDGWRLCPASVYQTHYRATPAPLADAWIAGCVAESSAGFLPLDRVCIGCSSGQGAQQDFGWRCSDLTPAYSSKEVAVGLTSSTTCHRVGIAVTATIGHWRTLGAWIPVSAAVCCRK